MVRLGGNKGHLIQLHSQRQRNLENLKIIVDNLIVSYIVCFRISPFASKEVEVIIPTPTNAQSVCAINKAGECVSSDVIARLL